MEKDWTQDTVTVNDGIELFYTRTGGDKPCIVLAHGITDSGLCWRQFASDLQETYDLIMYDAYGHGKSSRVDPKKHFNLSEDLHDLIVALKLEKPAIVGHSMGAATAASFAAAYPDLLSALVLEDPPWSDDDISEEQIKNTMSEWKEKSVATQKKTVKELIRIKKIESPNWEETILEPWARAKLDMDPAFYDHYSIKFPHWRDLLTTIKVPTLIVTGDLDRGAIVSPKMGVEAVSLHEKVEFGHISSAGHCVRYEQYAPYLTMTKLFLKRALPKG